MSQCNATFDEIAHRVGDFTCRDAPATVHLLCRPISPPSMVTALLRAMFCGLNGTTWMPRRASSRHSPAVITLLPASEVVP